MNRAHTCLKRDEVVKLIRTGRGFLLGGISHIIQLAVRVCRGKETHSWNHERKICTLKARVALGATPAAGQDLPCARTSDCSPQEGPVPPGIPPAPGMEGKDSASSLPQILQSPLLLRWGWLLDSSLPLHSFPRLLPCLRSLHPLILLPEGFNPAVGRECMGCVCDSQVPWERQGRQGCSSSAPAPPVATHIRSRPAQKQEVCSHRS